MFICIPVCWYTGGIGVQWEWCYCGRFQGGIVSAGACCPVDIFDLWYKKVVQTAHYSEPSAMVLATCDENGHPSARVVLLKRYSKKGFEFFTNYQSKKGKEIVANPAVALVFDWRHVSRQVRIEGVAEFLTSEESDAYYFSRPRASQISAWCCKQSNILENRDDLLVQIRVTEERFAGRQVPRPQYWGGFRVVPHLIEFWQEGEHRLHTRMQYKKSDGLDRWECVELYP